MWLSRPMDAPWPRARPTARLNSGISPPFRKRPRFTGIRDRFRRSLFLPMADTSSVVGHGRCDFGRRQVSKKSRWRPKGSSTANENPKSQAANSRERPCFHADRTAGRHRHHRHPRSTAPAGVVRCQEQGELHRLLEQPKTTANRLAHICARSQRYYGAHGRNRRRVTLGILGKHRSIVGAGMLPYGEFSIMGTWRTKRPLFRGFSTAHVPIISKALEELQEAVCRFEAIGLNFG